MGFNSGFKGLKIRVVPISAPLISSHSGDGLRKWTSFTRRKQFLPNNNRLQTKFTFNES